jgi:hypothetical protein
MTHQVHHVPVAREAAAQRFCTARTETVLVHGKRFRSAVSFVVPRWDDPCLLAQRTVVVDLIRIFPRVVFHTQRSTSNHVTLALALALALTLVDTFIHTALASLVSDLTWFNISLVSRLCRHWPVRIACGPVVPWQVSAVEIIE